MCPEKQCGAAHNNWLLDNGNAPTSFDLKMQIFHVRALKWLVWNLSHLLFWFWSLESLERGSICYINPFCITKDNLCTWTKAALLRGASMAWIYKCTKGFLVCIKYPNNTPGFAQGFLVVLLCNFIQEVFTTVTGLWPIYICLFGIAFRSTPDPISIKRSPELASVVHGM